MSLEEHLSVLDTGYPFSPDQFGADFTTGLNRERLTSTVYLLGSTTNKTNTDKTLKYILG